MKMKKTVRMGEKSPLGGGGRACGGVPVWCCGSMGDKTLNSVLIEACESGNGILIIINNLVDLYVPYQRIVTVG